MFQVGVLPTTLKSDDVTTYHAYAALVASSSMWKLQCSHVSGFEAFAIGSLSTCFNKLT